MAETPPPGVASQGQVGAPGHEQSPGVNNLGSTGVNNLGSTGVNNLGSAAHKMGRVGTKAFAKLVDKQIDKCKANPDKVTKIAAFASNKQTRAEDDFFNAWIKAKLREWDKDESGTFDRSELLEIMAELEETRAKQANLKWSVLGGFFGTFFLGAIALMVVYFVTIATKQTSAIASHGAASMQVTPGGRGSSQTATTASSDVVDTFSAILAFDDDNDKWIISDQKLRDVNVMQVQVPVEGDATAKKFIKFDVAYLLRSDSGPNGGTDKIELTSTTGHKMRFWETNNVLEVKLRGEGETWQTIPNAQTGSRRLEGMLSSNGIDAPGVPGLDHDLHKHYLSQHYGCEVEHDEFGRPIHPTDEPVFALDGPPRGRRTKGYYGGSSGTSMSGRRGTIYVFHNGYGPDGTYVGRGDNVYYQGEECWKRNETHYECGWAMGLGGFGSAHWLLMAVSIDAAIKFW